MIWKLICSALFASRDNATEDDKKGLVLNGLNSVVNYELGKIGHDDQICRAKGNLAECVYEIVTELLQFHVASNMSAFWEVNFQFFYDFEM